MQNGKDNLIVDLSFQFSLEIIKFTELLESSRKFTLSNQLFRSGTSIGANIRESQQAESRNDFIHKLKIASKEAEETLYWLQLCKQSENYPNSDNLISQVESIIKILSKIISTSHFNRTKSQHDEKPTKNAQ